MRSPAPKWSRNPHRARLLELYASADALLRDFACTCAPEGELAAPCCRFAVSGHEPYPTAVEIEEIRHAVRASSIAPRDPRKLPPPAPLESSPPPPVGPARSCRTRAGAGSTTLVPSDVARTFATPPMRAPR